MKLRAPREPFLQQLQLAAAFCPTRSPRPIFQDVLVEADEGLVTLTATDGEVSIRTRMTGLPAAFASTARSGSTTLWANQQTPPRPPSIRRSSQSGASLPP